MGAGRHARAILRERWARRERPVARFGAPFFGSTVLENTNVFATHIASLKIPSRAAGVSALCSTGSWGSLA